MTFALSSNSIILLHMLYGYHRRRNSTEDKAKVVAAVWGTELIKFLAVIAILNKDNLKE